jgi:hypothetical protein
MNDAAYRFLADANPASGVGFVPRAHKQPIVVLVVDDSGDDELASALAGGDGMAAADYVGAWSAQADGRRLIVKLRLTGRDGGWRRQWTYADPGGSVLKAITAGSHHVAIVPLIGNLGAFVRDGLHGAIIVEADALNATTETRELLAVAVPAG